MGIRYNSDRDFEEVENSWMDKHGGSWCIQKTVFVKETDDAPWVLFSMNDRAMGTSEVRHVAYTAGTMARMLIFFHKKGRVIKSIDLPQGISYILGTTFT